MKIAVSDLMTRVVTAVSPEMPLKEAAARLRAGGFSALPVVDRRGRLVGIVSEADLLGEAERPARRERPSPAHALVSRLMTLPVATADADASVAEAARSMLRYGVQRLPVVDRAGRPIGIVSRGDLLKVFLRPDEEIGRDVERCLRAEGAANAVAGVRDGVVVLAGPPENRVRQAVEAVEGVVAVRSAAAAQRGQGDPR